MRQILLLIIATSVLSAQYSNFAVTDDGRLYFDTPLSIDSVDAGSKIYRITSGGLALFATGSGGTNIFGPNVSFPVTSGDGSITAYSLNYPCSSGSCGLSGLPRSSFQLQGVQLVIPGFHYNLQISRNGRFLLGMSAFDGTRLVELPSQGSRKLTQYGPACNTQCVANSGAILLHGNKPVDSLLLMPLNGEPILVPGTESSTFGILSPDGSRIAYERQNGQQFELVLTDPQGSAHRVLAGSPIRSWFKPSFANDGTLLFLRPDVEGRGVPMLLTPAGEPSVLLTVETGVTQAIISGNAHLVWLGTAIGQLLRVRTADGVADEIVPESPQVNTNNYFALPGSVIRVPGMGFTPNTQFLLGGAILPVSERTATEIALQIPWEYDLENGSRDLIVRGPASPFQQRRSFLPADRPTISFERSNAGLLQAAHQDFHGVVSADDPARQGETLHIFARNMGPVDQPVATGQRSPSSPPARVITPLACYLIEFDEKLLPIRSQGIAVPFAGLSGGAIGVYQIDVTIPLNWYAAKMMVQCQMDSAPNRFLGDLANLPVAPPAVSTQPAATSPTP